MCANIKYHHADIAFHWLHRLGNTFLLNAYSRVYQILDLKTVAIHIVNIILSHDLVGVSSSHIHALDVR